MDTPWDIVIVGAGLGGLSLAVELAQPEFAHLSILLLDKRTHYVRDRTWSYWTGQTHRYSHLERKRWHSWSVSLNGQSHAQTSQQHAYATLDADAFYAFALEKIAGAPNIQLRLGCGVTCIERSAQGSVVALDTNDKIQAHAVLDARPLVGTRPHALVQQFAGWQVLADSDVFDPSKVQLMGFDPHPKGLHFWYLLPYSKREALVESTWISPMDWQPNFNVELEQYLTNLCGPQGYSVDYTERGILGLQDATLATLALGRRGGAMRASTGYAFIDTIEHAKRIAYSLAQHLKLGSVNHWAPQSFSRSATDLWMDRVFLDVLSRDWLQAPDYFMRIFSAVHADDAVAFLTGKAALAQKLRVVQALPKLPFLRSALSCARV